MNMQLMQVVYKASKTHKKPVDCNHIARLFYCISNMIFEAKNCKSFYFLAAR